MAQAWYRVSKDNGEAIRIFCFPYSGSSVQVFMPFAQKLPRGVAVYGYEMPGRGRRFPDDFLKTMNAIVSEAIQELPVLTENMGFMFWGHSLGGLIAFETARELRRRQLPLPKHLFVSGTRAAHLPRRKETFHNLPDNEFIQKIKIMGGTPDEILDNKEMLDLFMPVLRNDFKVFETYQYQPEDSLALPITAFSGAEDKFVKPEQIDGWAEHTSVHFSRHIYSDGGHFIITTHMDDILDVIVRTISIQGAG